MFRIKKLLQTFFWNTSRPIFCQPDIMLIHKRVYGLNFNKLVRNFIETLGNSIKWNIKDKKRPKKVGHQFWMFPRSNTAATNKMTPPALLIAILWFRHNSLLIDGNTYVSKCFYRKYCKSRIVQLTFKKITNSSIIRILS